MQNNDEIDVGVIFSKISSKISRGLALFATRIRKNFVLIATISLMGAILDGIYYSFQKPIYKAEIVLTSRLLSNEYCKYIIENLQNIRRENLNVFTKRTGLDSSIAKEVVSIEYKRFDEKIKEKIDSLSFQIPFKLVLRTHEPNNIDLIGKALVEYLENNEYALVKKKNNISHKKSIIDQLEKEQIRLDSLKGILIKNIIAEENYKNATVIGDKIDPTNAYKYSLDLFSQQSMLKLEMLNIKNIDLIEGPVVPTRPSEPILLIHILRGLFLGSLAAYFITLFKEKKSLKTL